MAKLGPDFRPAIATAQHTGRTSALKLTINFSQRDLWVRGVMVLQDVEGWPPGPIQHDHFARDLRLFHLASLCFFMPSLRNRMAFFGPPVPVIRNFFPRCLLYETKNASSCESIVLLTSSIVSMSS